VLEASRPGLFGVDPCALDLTLAVAEEPVTRAARRDPTQRLDVNADELAGPAALIAIGKPERA
jgi:hypothetical protein